MAKIISVYIHEVNELDLQHRRLFSHSMSYGRWFKIAEALRRQGHQVDVAVPDCVIGWADEPGRTAEAESSVLEPLNLVPLSQVNWHDYEVVKTVFHRGFATLEQFGGADHPFIVSKLGSVVAPEDRDGIYFYGEQRQWLFDVQCRISRASRYVTVLSEAAKALWVECHGSEQDTLLVPGGVDDQLPDPNGDPYPADGTKRCVFAGNIYASGCQGEANRLLVGKLNQLGKYLRPLGVRVYLLGDGDTDRLNPEWVTHLGAVSYERSWDYLHHADVGIVVSAGSFMHNNESTKIYHYLRAGLPVVSESGFPNDAVVTESGGGYLVDGEDMREMAERVKLAADTTWDVDRMVRYVIDHHTWDARAEVYRDVIAG